jgi:hypothetical protein
MYCKFPFLLLIPCAFGLSACPFAPAIPEEEDPPNLPPLISPDFLEPNSDEVTLPRDGEPLSFRVSQLLDRNQDDKLEARWYSSQTPGDGVLAEAILQPDPTNTDLYQDLFTRYTGTQYSLDPCDGQWPQGEDRFTLTLFVADGDLLIINGQAVVAEGVFVDRYTWVLNFTGRCPEDR